MSDAGEHTAPRKRGEAAWKAEREAIARRNDEARKVGRDERRAQERRAGEARHAADLRERAATHGKSGPV